MLANGIGISLLVACLRRDPAPAVREDHIPKHLSFRRLRRPSCRVARRSPGSGDAPPRRGRPDRRRRLRPSPQPPRYRAVRSHLPRTTTSHSTSSSTRLSTESRSPKTSSVLPDGMTSLTSTLLPDVVSVWPPFGRRLSAFQHAQPSGLRSSACQLFIVVWCGQARRGRGLRRGPPRVPWHAP